MKIKTTLFGMAIFANISCSALNYFWVGGSGTWSDFNNHWATTSGGSIFHNQVPQLTDNPKVATVIVKYSKNVDKSTP